MSILHTLAPVRSVETSRMTSQTTLIASPSAAGRHECRRRVTCAMDDAWWKSSRHRMSQETVTGRFLLPLGRRRLAAGGVRELRSMT
ncbi:hypothetical protein EVAR_19864_1 [Eumeta japonica]|uniref:Uncharacterized protein n=1 Tax=Eumeta variegata TaxID=151549 RepID=A0A4C1XN34_EUMVA|nr:hypothetical protein EVAR_19864_1 [Eumeta japonica]